MAPTTDPHQGGRLEDMAQHGTSLPNDAGLHRTIPSVPRPDQINPPASLSHTSPAVAADNSFDIPRSTRDSGPTGAVMTGTGDALHANVEKKNLDDAGLWPGAKGHDREAKHLKKGNFYDKMAQEHHGVQAAPGEEGLDQETLLERRERK
jgi:hypothetical protein